MLLINAEELVMGRLASYCAKKALQGDEIVIVNAEKAMIIGGKKDLLQRFQQRFDLSVKGNPRKGPKASRMPDKILRNAVKGMLPVRRKKGMDAIKRVRVFIGLPEKFNEKEFVQLEGFKGDKSKNFMFLGELSKLLGAKW